MVILIMFSVFIVLLVWEIITRKLIVKEQNSDEAKARRERIKMEKLNDIVFKQPYHYNPRRR